VVTASYDRTARVWNATTGQVIATLEGHTGDVNSAAFSPDGLRVVTASYDHAAWLWNTAVGQPIAKLEGHSDCVNNAAFSPDGQRLVTASEDRTARANDRLIHSFDLSRFYGGGSKRVVGLEIDHRPNHYSHISSDSSNEKASDFAPR
jgi:WD40 repeat protein